MSTPSINQGQIAIDPVNGILYYKTRTDLLVNTSLNLLQESASLIATEDSLEVGGDFVVSGDFTVSGNTIILNTETLLVEDNIIVLNSNVTGTPTVNAGIEINRGNVANVQIIWNETTNKWQFTNDGINYYDIGSVETASINDLADVVLSNSASGDFLRYNGSVWINDPVNLSTDTIGDYVANITAGDAITIANSGGENANPTISVTINTFDSYGSAANAYSNAVSYSNSISANTYSNAVSYANSVSSNAYANAVAYVDSRTLDNLFDVNVSTAANGDFLRYNGNTWINDPVNLSTDTVGDYVANITAGDAIEISNSGGEAASPVVSVAPNSIDGNHISLTFEYVENIIAGNNIIATNDYVGPGQVGNYTIETSATPNFDSVTTTSLFVDNIEIDPTGASSTDQVLRFDGTKFIPGVASTVASLSDLTDVSSATPSTGEFLYWNGTEWTPAVPPTGVPVVSSATPSTPVSGQLWFDSDNARTFIYYDLQWIEIGTVATNPDLAVSKVTEVIGNGASSYTVIHNLNTRNIIVEIYDNATYETITTSIARTTLDSITVSFAAPVSANAYTVVIVG